MSKSIDLSVSISEKLLNQALLLAQRLGMSPDHLVERALENFIKSYQAQLDSDAPPSVETQSAASTLAVNQGDIYWVQLENPNGLEASIPHPQVVIQDDILNQSRIHTVVVCGLTSNVGRASAPGNVLLDVGEANLSRQSVVEVSKLSTVAKTQLGGYIGSLSKQRVNQILAGMQFLQRSFLSR